MSLQQNAPHIILVPSCDMLLWLHEKKNMDLPCDTILVGNSLQWQVALCDRTFKFRKPKIDKLTNSTQLYPSLESKMLWLLFRGDLWSRDLLVKTIYMCRVLMSKKWRLFCYEYNENLYILVGVVPLQWEVNCSGPPSNEQVGILGTWWKKCKCFIYRNKWFDKLCSMCLTSLLSSS